MLNKEPYKEKLRMVDWVVKEEPIYFYVSKKSPRAAVALVDRALHTLKESGELARIYARWARPR